MRIPMTEEVLARFSEPMSWTRIVQKPRASKHDPDVKLWRDFVVRAEEAGLLKWIPGAGWVRQLADDSRGK